MLLNVIKGAYPSLQQISQDLLISAEDSAKLERGSCLVQNTTVSGSDTLTTWKVASATDQATATPVFFSLHGADDYQTKMAGTLSSSGGYAPRVSALSCTQAMEIETDMFSGDGIKAGDYLMVGADGKLVKHTSGNTAVLKVTKGPYTRWSNNMDATGASAGFRQGANVEVVRGLTVFLPKLVTA